MHLRTLYAVAIAIALGSISSTSRAQERSACAPITRENVVRCALAASPAVRRDRHGIAAAEGRVRAAAPVFPSNPTLTGTIARRASNGVEPATMNWTASLSQEVEIAGQRGARLRATEGEASAQKSRTLGTERDAASLAWTAYFDAIADREALRLAERMEKVGTLLAQAARARADRGVASSVDADVAEATQIRLVQERFASTRRAWSARSALSSMTGGDPLSADGDVEGELVPLHAVDTVARDAASSAARPEIAAARAEERVFEARASVFRRARIPNLTVSGFAQNDGYDEKVLGLGLSVPIPLPGLGRTYAGEIAEADALAARASSEADRLARAARLDLATALQAHASRRTELEAFSRERLERAEKSLGDIATEIEGGRLGVREALFAQQALIDLLRAHLEARRALCLASVDLARAANLPLERGVQ